MAQALDFSQIWIADDVQARQTAIDALRNQHPSDIAEVLVAGEETPTKIVEILSEVGNHKAIEAFAKLPIEVQEDCLEEGNSKILLRFVENMDPDDRVDLLKAVDDEVRESIMPLIAQAERNEIRKLWEYEEGQAGAVMTTEYAMLPKHLSVAAALERLRLQAPNKETIYYVYITDEARHLLGIISLRDLIMAKPRATLDTIMETNVINVPHDMDIEEVSAVISKYDILAVPVVDTQNRLLGIVTVDDVLDIIEAESTEDFQLISAVLPFDEQYFKRPLPRLFWSRFIWLAVLLFTSLLSTSIMEMNQAILTQMMALAFFIPMVMGTCGNAGTQSATMIVRSMAVGEITPGDFWRVFRRELVMGLLLGGALGFMAYFRVFLQDYNVMLGFIVSTALLATLLTANLIGALMPLILKKIKLDPALTAGPFIATIIDALGIAIYFFIAFLLMRTF